MPWSKIKYSKSLRALLTKADTRSRVSSCMREIAHRPAEFEPQYKRVKHGWNTCIENAQVWKKKTYTGCPYACLTPACSPCVTALCENYLIAPIFKNHTMFGESTGILSMITSQKSYLQTRKNNRNLNENELNPWSQIGYCSCILNYPWG